MNNDGMTIAQRFATIRLHLASLEQDLAAEPMTPFLGASRTFLDDAIADLTKAKQCFDKSLEER